MTRHAWMWSQKRFQAVVEEGVDERTKLLSLASRDAKRLRPAWGKLNSTYHDVS
jgi:hypothetical protein